MDLSEIKSKLAKLQAKPGSNKTDKKNSGWKPSIGKQNVRIVPNKYNKKNPFTELYFYYGIGKKVMISPLSWGDKDPIAEFAKQLRSTNDKENWRLAKKLDPKMRIFAPVIVRGEEANGIKLWQFGKELYMDFLNLADNEDVGDFTDVAEGRDIIINTVGPDVTGTQYNKSTIMARTKVTPLSEDANQIQNWLDEQPNPLEEFKKYSFDEMKSALQEWLTPEEPEEGSIIDDEVTTEDKADDLPWEAAPKTPNYTLTAKPAPKASKFDALFDDED